MLNAIAGEFRKLATNISVQDLENDLQSIRSGRYRHEHGLLWLDSLAIVWGSGSGFIPFYLARVGRFEKIWCVEPNDAMRNRVAAILGELGETRVDFVESDEEVRQRLSDEKHEIGFVLFLANTYSRPRMELLASHRVKFLSGEFDVCKHNPIRVYRYSAKFAEKFFWFTTPGEKSLVGTSHEGPEISIVVPAFKVVDCLRECVESLVHQTLKSKEIIIVDDGSPDGTGVLADQLAEAHDCVRVIHKPNGGCASARSAGWKAAKGLYVGFVDADDWCDQEMFERLFAVAVVYNADIAHCGFRKVHINTGKVEEFSDSPELVDETVFGGLAVEPIAFAASYPAIWSRIYRKSFLESQGIDFAQHLRRFDDLPFQFETFARASKVVFVRGAYYNYRFGRPGQDVAVRDKRHYVHFEIFKLLHEVSRSAGNLRVEWQFKSAQIASHAWVMKVILPDLRREYAVGAAKDLFERRDLLSVLDIFRIAYQRSASRLVFGLYLLWLFQSSRQPFPVEA